MARVAILALVTLVARDKAGDPVETAPGGALRLDAAEAASLIERGLAAPAPAQPKPAPAPAETVDGGPETDVDDEDAER